MKAAVMRGVGQPLTIEEVLVPEISSREVLVETRSCGVCGTDLHILKGLGYVPPLPHILGHEPAGVVSAVGSEVAEFKPGDRVVPHLFFNCGNCYYCRMGRQQQCRDLKGILGVLVNGAFAEYFKVPADNLFVLPGSVPFDVGGLLADAIVTSVHAYKRSDLKLGDVAVVIGCGGLGLTLLQVLKAAGIRLVAVDRSKESLALAQQLGADLTLWALDSERVKKLGEFTEGFGARGVFDCVGKAQTIRDGVDYLMRCGRLVVIGEEPDKPDISTTEIAQKELEVIGSRNGTRQDTVEAIRLVESGVVKPPIARRFPLDEINDALECVREGPIGRVIVQVKD